jgi:hypothetical protein
LTPKGSPFRCSEFRQKSSNFLVSKLF